MTLLHNFVSSPSSFKELPDTPNTFSGQGGKFAKVNSGETGIEFTASDSMAKISTTTVAFDTTGQTTLYTVPTGKIFVPILVVIRAGADAAQTDVTFGRSTALTDWLSTIQLDNLDADGDQVKIELSNANPPTKSKTYAAGVLFQIDVTVAQGGATNYVDLFGYEINA